jgi:hypothetical protein
MKRQSLTAVDVGLNEKEMERIKNLHAEQGEGKK